MKIIKIKIIVLTIFIINIYNIYNTHENISNNICNNMKKTYRAPVITTAQDITKLFPTSIQEINERTSQAINQAEVALENIISLPTQQRTFENTAYAFDTLKNNLSQEGAIFWTVMETFPQEDLRKSAFDAINKLNEFSIQKLSQNKQLYKAFKEYIENKCNQEELNPEETYYLEESIKGFKRGGLELPDKQQDAIKQINQELAILGQTFDKNISDDVKHINVGRDDLDGLTEEFINSLPTITEKKEGQETILYSLDTSYPIVTQVMQNCNIESTRKKVWAAFNSRAWPKNNAVLNDIIRLRDELAGKLGYKSYAHYDIDDEMAQNPEKVEQFLKDIQKRSLPKAELEIKRYLDDLPKNITLSENKKIKPWDLNYIKNCYKKKHYNLDNRLIAEYFPVESTLDALLDIYQQFLGICFKQVQIQGLWAPEVRAVQVNSKDGHLIGYLLLDLFPRPGKFTHACNQTLMAARKNKDGSLVPGLSIVIANFPKPTPQKPALLTHIDVTTFFHEFGHALHASLGATQLASFSGTSVKTDFVEMPSQMLEEWMWDKAIIKKVSKHYKTGNSLPDNLIDTMILLKNFDEGDGIRRQLGFAYISLNYFKVGAIKDTAAIKKLINQEMRPYIESSPEDHYQVAFGHLTGYGAKYYGYLWSKVFALDLFEYIKEHGGLLDSKMGQKYINTILSKGGSQPPQELLHNFLGREPKSDAFFKDIGL